ncbi:unnamed protein product [Prorocentrum cordatum]|uniref:Fibronectin type-III domain-containing protein n=1 Tax=Prorocentrum cordatum TaxID=2364126 RepID=A0ABN9YAN5_9DINO|nr:unnamed protein product [Polarella glacialis]
MGACVDAARHRFWDGWARFSRLGLGSGTEGQRPLEALVQMAVQSDVGWSKYSPFCPPDKIAKPIQLDPPVLEVVHGDRIQVIWEPPKLGLPCTAYAVALNDGKVTLYLDAKGAPHDNKDNASIIPATQTSIMVPLLLENVAYKAQVASRNMLGWGPYSNFSQTQTVVKELKKMSPVVQVHPNR